MRPFFMRPFVVGTALMPCLLLLALPAHAQYPGPANSGGGWVAQKNPNIPPYQPSNTYAWTPFTVTSSTVNHAGVTSTGSGSVYGYYQRSGEPVGGGADQRESHFVSGTATYQWLWTPTGSNVGAPPPPLYVLTKATGYANLASGNGLSGDATLNYTSSVSVFRQGGDPVPASQYKIVAAAGSAPAKAVMSPTFSSHLIGTPTGDSGIGNVGLSTVAYPIVITAPNPMSRPDLGDGTNQFVYDAVTPQGNLIFPGAVNVAGSSADDTLWLQREPKASPHVALTLDLPTESAEKDEGLIDHNLLSSVPDSALVVKYDSTPNPGPGDGFRFLGLPKMNTSSGPDIGFGNHLVTLKVDGKTSQQAHIQTFFSALASNYPGADKDYTASSTDAAQRFATPNWYHYYNQASTASGPYDNLGQSASHIDLSPPYDVHIHDDAYNQYSIPVYSLNKPIKITDAVKCLCKLSISGIHTYIFICAHEAGHKSLSQQVDTNGQPTVYNWMTKDTGGSFTLPYSKDGDEVVDAWEIAHHMSSTSNNTPSYKYDNTDDEPDDEVIADIQGLGGLFAKVDAWQKDWANQGLQINKPYFNPVPTANQEGFYFVFTPTDTTQPAFHVHSLSDLTAHYPGNTVLTDVTQMVGP